MKTVFFCTGARNQELLPLFNEDQILFEYDERMASFKALGLAKMSGTPSIICTTSGTAVAECVPAMLEAFYSNTKLVLVTGDRPKKMHGSGAPQTINHEGLTSTCRRSYIELSLEEFKTFKYENLSFPAHINVLVDDSLPHQRELKTHSTMKGFEDFLKSVSKPLILVSHEETSMRPFVEKLKGQLFYAETMSEAKDLSPLQSEKQLLELFRQQTFDSVIRIGHTPLSKVWRLLEMQHLPTFSFDSRGLSGLSYGEVLKMSSKDLLENQDFWNGMERFKTPLPAAQNLDGLYQKYPHSEISLMEKLQNSLPEESIVYLGNSLVVRFFELVQRKPFKIMGSRGVNGIDGQLATAIGIALGTTEDVLCILGDMTTLYDLSSLREMPTNLKLVIMNNGGGRIFDMLKLDKRIVMEHEKNFEKIIQGFGLRYSQNLADLQSVQVLELLPDQAQTRAFLKEWNS
jgi:2-succinyl-5-enolpyruvyl-6-hydroxy-3-cyclohexene-1-carboxylate synthase